MRGDMLHHAGWIAAAETTKFIPEPTRRLRIAVIAHVRHPIAPPFMGGMEAHCDLLVRGLGRAGHDVRLFASADSAADLPLHPIAPVAYEAELPWALWHGSKELNSWLGAAYARCWSAIVDGDYDIVHNNTLFPDLHDWAARDGVPMLTSLHIPPFDRLRTAIERADVPWLRQTLTSVSQRQVWTSLNPERVDIAWNGIDLKRWRFQPRGNGRAVWYGRITPNKGTVEALRAATAAGIGLDIIGPIECSTYFAEVKPLLTAPHRHLGHLSGKALVEAVGAASVMIATPMWDEPFGLTLVEAMACGVPVAALDRGAMREVIGDKGVVADTPETLANAIQSAMVKDRLAARARVEANFTAEAMIARYETAYAATLAGAYSVSSPAARASSLSSTVQLLA